MKIHITILIITILQLTACTNKTDEQTVFFPVLAECKEYSENHFNKPFAEGLDVEYIPFHQTIESSPNIVGFFKITSTTRNKKQLQPILNGPISTCFPNSSTEGKLHDVSPLNSLEGSIDFMRTHSGSDKVYVVVEGDKYKVFAHKPLVYGGSILPPKLMQ